MSDELAEAKELIKTLQGQIQSLQYMKNHDYKFLIQENKKLTHELNEVKEDNRKLSQQISSVTEKLRNADF